MNTSYIIFLLTFLVFPIAALIISKYTTLEKFLGLVRPAVMFFFIHNAMYIQGYSVKGDYFDYWVFAIEYFVFCFVVFSLFNKIKVGLYARIFRAFGFITILIGLIAGFFGIFFFIAASQDYETDNVFHFTGDGKNYETRRYSFGFVTFSDTKYTFETYRKFKYLPFEKEIDKSVFFGLKTNLDLADDSLDINIVNVGGKKRLLFKSTNGHTFSKPLE